MGDILMMFITVLAPASLLGLIIFVALSQS
jgi:hypothetical protein